MYFKLLLLLLLLLLSTYLIFQSFHSSPFISSIDMLYLLYRGVRYAVHGYIVIKVDRTLF